MQKAIRDKMTTLSGTLEDIMPHDLVNSKMITSTITEFLHQGNYLNLWIKQIHYQKLLTKKTFCTWRGWTCKREAGFEVRDVHPTHYGRICPVETPEGQNIGLINTLSTFSKVNDLGFIEAPYKKSCWWCCNKWNFILYSNSRRLVIAPGSTKVDENGKIVEPLIEVRKDGEILLWKEVVLI